MNSQAPWIALLLFSTLISSVSQVILKKAAMKTYDSPLKEYLNPPVLGAYAIFFLATLLGVLSYRGLEVSLGTLLESSGYLFVLGFDLLIFHEKLTPRKLIGALLVLSGIAVTVLL